MTIARFFWLASFGLVTSIGPTPANAAAHRTVSPAQKTNDWTHVATVTDEGGIRTGNPAAKIKLVEYFSFTCPHCAAFATEAFPKILQDYVQTGRVNFELRAALRDPIDLVVASVARAAKPAQYVDTVLAIMAKQSEWEPKAIDYVGAHRDQLNAGDKVQAIHAMLGAIGLEAILVQHGIPSSAIEPALNDKATQAALDKSSTDAWTVLKIGGTPGFLINDKLQDGVFGWPALEANVQAASKS